MKQLMRCYKVVSQSWHIRAAKDYWAVRMQAPPTALIFSSALREKNRALTMTGCLGRAPLPRTLKKPARETSMTGALSLLSAYFVRVCSDTKDQSLSRLTVGQQYTDRLECLWKFLIPTFPKYPE